MQQGYFTLDEPLIYTTGNFFPGFTTGEVTLVFMQTATNLLMQELKLFLLVTIT